MRLELLFLPLLLLTSCTEGGTHISEECGSNASCPRAIFNADEPIIGLWDRVKPTNSEQDVLYTSISRFGQFLTYDYQQDDFGTGENCHNLEVGSINSGQAINEYRIYQPNLPSGEGFSDVTAIMIRNSENMDVNWRNGDAEVWTLVSGVAAADLVLCDS